MKNKDTAVFGQRAPAVRLTPLGAALLALLIALPGGLLLTAIGWLWL